MLSKKAAVTAWGTGFAVCAAFTMFAGFTVSATTGCKSETTATSTGGVEFVTAEPLSDVAPWIASEVTRAAKDDTRLLVYVGASWCEPCETFHRAAQAGKLNAALPKLRLLSFDADRDSDALTRAGYGSEMIPLFAEARADGQASGRKVMGSVKGDAAIGDLTPRILSLLALPQ